MHSLDFNQQFQCVISLFKQGSRALLKAGNDYDKLSKKCQVQNVTVNYLRAFTIIIVFFYFKIMLCVASVYSDWKCIIYFLDQQIHGQPLHFLLHKVIETIHLQHLTVTFQ